MKPGFRIFSVGFFFGLLIGGVAARIAGPKFGHRAMSPEKRQERILKRLASDLKLGDDQRKDVERILQEGRKKMDDLMEPLKPRFGEVRKETNAKIRQMLNPEQQSKFDAVTRKMENKWRDRRGLPPGPDVPGQP